MQILDVWKRSFSIKKDICSGGAQDLSKKSSVYKSSLNKGSSATLMYNICYLVENITADKVILGSTRNGYIAKNKDSNRLWACWIPKENRLLTNNGNYDELIVNGFWIAPFVAYCYNTYDEFKKAIEGVKNDFFYYYIICDFLYFSRMNYINDQNIYEQFVEKTDIEPRITKYYTGKQKERSTSIKRKADKDDRNWASYSLNANIDSDRAKWIPSYNLDDMIITDKISSIARQTQTEIGGANPINNFLLYGEPGAGKTTMAKILAQLWKLPYKNFNFSFGFEMSDIAGEYKPQPDGTFKFRETNFIDFYKNGGVFELTELDYAKAEVLGFLNTPLDPELNILSLGDGTEIKRDPYCILIATMNVNDVACQKMAKALRRRFQRKVLVQKPKREDFIRIIKQKSGYTDNSIINEMIDVCELVCRMLKDQQLDEYECTTSEIINWAQDTKFTGDPIESSYDTLVSGVAFDPVVQDQIIDIVHQIF